MMIQSLKLINSATPAKLFTMGILPSQRCHESILGTYTFNLTKCESKDAYSNKLKLHETEGYLGSTVTQ